MTAADSARFKDFEPQWDKTLVELLPNNEKMLIVPVVRNLQINYNQDIGFIRRLCIRVDANDDFLEANIVELIGNLTFVKENHNAIFKDYKENNITGFQGSVIIYELNYDTQVVKYYNQGVFLKNSLPIVYNSDTQRPYPCWMFISYWNEGSCPYGNSGLPAHGTATNCNGGGYWETVGMMGICEDNGGSSGGGYGGGEGSGSNGTGGAGGGSSGSTGTNNPRPRPRPAIRPPQPPNTVWDEECFCWMPEDIGVSWNGAGWGDGVPRDANGNPVDANGNPLVVILPPPLGVTKDPSMTAAANAQINCVYETLVQQNNVRTLLDKFGGYVGLQLTIKVGALPGRTRAKTSEMINGSVTITINPKLQNTVTGSFLYSPLGIAKTIAHEMMHARLDALIANAGGVNATNTGMLDPLALPTIHALMLRHRKNGQVNIGRVQHEYIATYWHADLVAMIKEFDGNRATQAEYEALAWDGLEDTDRYSGVLFNSLGYSDKNMDKNREATSKAIKDARVNENPCR